ncbi:MAG: bifunctional oligoribonuclease/PAP phosphatase NrnA [Patescibacteria group bacterium]|jgi:phosphoesterase RecJ-like protein
MVDLFLAQKILDKILTSKKILILGHSIPKPDGDSLGSCFAFGHYLKSITKNFTIFNLYPVPASLSYLPGVNFLKNNPEEIYTKEYDLVVMVDFGQLKNSGIEEKLREIKKTGTTFINIDHHQNPEPNFFDISLVITDASSTCEIVYNLFVQMGIIITKDIATCLLTGLVTDTENFTNLGTTFTALRTGAELLGFGARLQEVTINTWQNKKLPILHLWGIALLRLEEDPQTGIATTAITLKDLEDNKVSPDDFAGVANFLNNLGTAKAVIIFKEEDGGFVRGSLRTTRDDVDVSEIARQYGGGGHKKSAGFLVRGRIEKVEGKGWKVTVIN